MVFPWAGETIPKICFFGHIFLFLDAAQPCALIALKLRIRNLSVRMGLGI
jgi:hypothetical protein